MDLDDLFIKDTIFEGLYHYLTAGFAGHVFKVSDHEWYASASGRTIGASTHTFRVEQEAQAWVIQKAIEDKLE